MGKIVHDVDCDHVLGHCAVFPHITWLCPHGRVQASCETCLDQAVDLEVQLALMEEGGMSRDVLTPSLEARA